MKPTVLVVDDNPANVQVLEGILAAAGFRILPALNGESALRAAQMTRPDAVLLDVRMPGLDGYEVCRRLKAIPTLADVPVVFLSALHEVEDKVEAFRAGGVDYITKPFQAEEVLSRVRTHVELSRSRRLLAEANAHLEELVAARTAELSAANARLSYMVYYDDLTGLLNRHAFLDHVETELARADRHVAGFALLFIDVDEFKQINDVLGHAAGDEYLRLTAARLAAHLRAGDLLCRWGSDEFIVLALDLEPEAGPAASLAQSVALSLAEVLSEPVKVADQEVQLNASIGIALYPGDGKDAAELIQRAELAMSRAKQSGRNQIHFYRPEMQSDAARRMTLGRALRQALATKQFLLHYQPQVDAAGRLIGAEALVRWHHPERGLVPPSEFIPLAEELGLIGSLGEWVLADGVQWLGKLNGAGQALPMLSVNVSARQFHEAGFAERCLAVLRDAGISPERVELEVTESLLLADIDGALAKIGALREAGFGFAVDDFGTGYSSLAYLKRLPVQKLKIDRSFVQDVHRDEKNAAIVRTIIALAKNLGMQTIAEGTEHREEVDFLIEAGCDAFQGYYFGKPLASEEFIRRWLAAAPQ